ncbi:MAG: caspase family protein [Deltaproteobacteria bacterium]|nr:caspase family protein [Deltaproteobacteria bacterium]
MMKTWLTLIVPLLAACAGLDVREDAQLQRATAGLVGPRMHLVSQVGHGSPICRLAVAAAAPVAASIDCPGLEAKAAGAAVDDDVGARGSIRVWDVKRRSVLAALAWNDGFEARQAKAFVAQLALSPDGETLAVVGPTVQVFDVSSATLTGRLLPGVLYDEPAAAFSAATFCGPGHMLVGTTDGQVLDWRVGASLKVVTTHKSQVGALACAADRWTAVDAKGFVSAGRFDAPGIVATLDGAGEATAMALQGSRALTLARATGRVVLWDLDEHRPLRTFNAAAGARWIGFANGGQEIQAGDGSRWSSSSGARLQATPLPDTLQQVPVGPEVLAVRGASLVVHRDGAEVARLGVSPDPLVAAVLSSDGRVIATAQRSGLHVWSTELLQQHAVLPGLHAPLAISDDGRHVAAICGAAICEVATESARILRRWRLPAGEPRRVVWSSSASHSVAVVYGDGTVVHQDLASGAQVVVDAGNAAGGAVSWVSLAPSAAAVAVARGAGVDIEPSVSFRSLPSGNTIQVPLAEGALDASWYADGRHLLVQYADHALVLRADDGETLRWLEPRAGQGVRTSALATDGARIAQGTDAGLVQLVELSDGESRMLLVGHSSPIQSIAWSGDSRVLMTAEADGGVRLWRFAAFSGHSAAPHGDAEAGSRRSGPLRAEAGPAAREHVSVALASSGVEWAAWADDGLFDSSRRGTSLLGAVVDGRVFPLEQEAARLNRPDLLLERLGLAPLEAVEHFRAHFQRRVSLSAGAQDEGLFDKAPVVKLAEAGAVPGALRLTIDVQRSGRTQWAVLDNGVEVARGEVERPAPGPFDVDVKVQVIPGRNLIEAFVVDAAGAESSHDQLTLWNNARLGNPTLYVIAFGVSRYQDTRLNLAYADADALELAAALRENGGRFGAVVVRALTDAEVMPGVVDAIPDFLSAAQPQDTVVVFLAGHGTRSRDAKADFYFMSYATDVERVAETSVPMEQLVDVIARSAPRQRLLLLDACESGDADAGEAVPVAPLAGRRSRALPMLTRGFQKTTPAAAVPEHSWRVWRQRDRLIYSDLLRRDGIVVVASSRASEFSYELDEAQHGAFTHGVIEALSRPAADVDGDGRVQVSELKTYLIRRVSELTQGLQHPTIDRDNPHADLSLPALERPPAVVPRAAP